MARKTVLVSDLSGEQIEENEYAKVTIDHGSRRYVVDALMGEVRELTKGVTPTKRPGRKKVAA